MPFSFAVPHAVSTNTGIGSTCSVSTTANVLEPGTVVEGKRAIWQLGQGQAYNGGSDGLASTQGDNTLFLDQGIFAPKKRRTAPLALQFAPQTNAHPCPARRRRRAGQFFAGT